MTEGEVVESIGRPPNRYLFGDETNRIIGGDLADVWDSPGNNLVVIFKLGKVKSFGAVLPQLTESYAVEAKPYDPGFARQDVIKGRAHNNAEPGTAERVVNEVSGIYLTAVCPGVYRKPVLWMTAADMQLVQACNANGFMVFGAYFYMGGQW